MTITNHDITKIMEDVFYSDPEAIALALLSLCAEEDGDGVRSILDECKARGIDLGPTIAKQIDRTEQLFGKSVVRVSNRHFRVPFKAAK